jgi:hypothetical protein
MPWERTGILSGAQQVRFSVNSRLYRRFRSSSFPACGGAVSDVT